MAGPPRPRGTAAGPAPWASVIVPTCGRDTLARTLRSIRCQAPAADVEILCVGDTYQADFVEALGAVPALCAQYGARYLAHDGGVHAWGHPQRAFGEQQATGAWLLWSQDDDGFTPGAFAAIRAELAGPPGPRLFRLHTWQAGTVWREPVLQLANIDAGCLCVPNVPARLGRWEPSYNGDYAMIAETCARWGGTPRWCEAVIAVGRHDPRRQFGGPRVAE